MAVMPRDGSSYSVAQVTGIAREMHGSDDYDCVAAVDEKDAVRKAQEFGLDCGDGFGYLVQKFPAESCLAAAMSASASARTMRCRLMSSSECVPSPRAMANRRLDFSHTRPDADPARSAALL